MADLLDDAQRLDWLQLIKSENVGPATFRQLVNHYGGASSALEALPELSRRGGLRRNIKIYQRQAAERDMENADKFGARFIALGESNYPAMLQHIDSAPPLICVKGREELLTANCIAIVGARNASAVGRKIARLLANELGRNNYVIASGMARGIDTACHEASLETGTIAVLAGGLDVIYPPENSQLHRRIGEDGVLVSEMTLGTKPKAEFFPRRNRIIAGVSLGVVVVEAALRSGSLITARMAGEQGREVFAVPGSPMDPRAAGTNKLIKDGAVLTCKARDVLDVTESMPSSATLLRQEMDQPAYDNQLSGEPPQIAGTERENIAGLLGPVPIEIDELIRESGLTTQVVLTILLELELAGRIERHPGPKVNLIPEDHFGLFD